MKSWDPWACPCSPPQGCSCLPLHSDDSSVLDKLSCSLGWPPICHVAKDDLKPLNALPPLTASSTDMHPWQQCQHQDQAFAHTKQVLYQLNYNPSLSTGLIFYISISLRHFHTYIQHFCSRSPPFCPLSPFLKVPPPLLCCHVHPDSTDEQLQIEPGFLRLVHFT